MGCWGGGGDCGEGGKMGGPMGLLGWWARLLEQGRWERKGHKGDGLGAEAGLR